ncbi:MAG: hypothetical protein HY540_00025 [Deltaproteobacteria bacterium]|nr:hypothetical protein [Deltaproteobacteria bacterium]
MNIHFKAMMNNAGDAGEFRGAPLQRGDGTAGGRTRIYNRFKMNILLILLMVIFTGSCSKPLLVGRVLPKVDYASQSFSTTANDAYVAVRKALYRAGYSVTSEDLKEGVLQTTWVPATSDSHYLPLFERRDFAPTGSYHQLEVQIVPEGEKVLVRVGSRMKSLAVNLKSSELEEQKILTYTADALRNEEPNVTNIGLNP